MSDQKIVDFLRDEGVRISANDRWLIVEDDGSYTVYSCEYGYGQKKTCTQYTGDNLDEALKVLAE